MRIGVYVFDAIFVGIFMSVILMLWNKQVTVSIL